jgi:undecaprenyl phosphate-alpha-L-ara4FN deformylase
MQRKIIALRIDVDTLRGTSKGVPRLVDILGIYGVRGTFYFSVGPDNMGRHLWRLFKPTFLWKMLRTNAAGLYGPEIVLMGTAWPGIKIGKHCSQTIKNCIDAGHECGFHAWDHHRSQAKLMNLSFEEQKKEIERGVGFLTDLVGRMPSSSAAPGWRTSDAMLKAKECFDFKYNSDCRGVSPFYPLVDGRRIEQLQIPVTLPTYDEVVGRNGITDADYNNYQISLLKPDAVNVLTIHAEAEGGKCAAMFEEYLAEVIRLGYEVVPLGEVADLCRDTAPTGEIVLQPFPGREGVLAVQKQQ